MKKVSLFAFILMLLTILLYCIIINPHIHNNNTQKKPLLDLSTITKDFDINEYNMDVELNPSSKTLSGREIIYYVNNENVSLNYLYFHIYPNAFKDKNTAPSLFNEFSTAYPEGFSPGYIDISKILAHGEPVKYSLSGNGNTILKIALPSKLKPGDKLKIVIDFSIKMPNAAERFGVVNNIFNLGNWYPVAAVYDKSGWNLDPYYPIGDPFYSDVSNYRINLTVPKNYIPASTGSLIKEYIRGNKKIYVFEETSVRDFALCISSRFVIDEKIVDGIKLKCYYLDKKNNEAPLAAEKSLKSFNELFGKYPYKTYSVVETNFPSGMEYPGIVFIGTNFYKDKTLKPILETVIVHETAHQWWYGVIGNDEIDEAWLDESLTTYSEVIFYYNNYGDVRGKNYFQNNILYNYEDSLNRTSMDKRILKSLSEFKNWDDYGYIVYDKGAIMLNSLRIQVGDKVFLSILKNYYSKYKFKNASTLDFISIVEEATNKDWDDFFNKWLRDKV